MTNVVIIKSHGEFAGEWPHASTLYMRFVARNGTQKAPEDKVGYIVLPERLTRAEWEALEFLARPLK